MYVPTPPPPSREAQELAGYLQRVIDAYQRDHPNVSTSDINRALTMTRAAHVSNRTLVIRIAAIVLAGGIMLVLASQAADPSMIWIVLGAVVIMVVLAIFKTKRLGV